MVNIATFVPSPRIWSVSASETGKIRPARAPLSATNARGSAPRDRPETTLPRPDSDVLAGVPRCRLGVL